MLRRSRLFLLPRLRDTTTSSAAHSRQADGGELERIPARSGGGPRPLAENQIPGVPTEHRDPFEIPVGGRRIGAARPGSALARARRRSAALTRDPRCSVGTPVDWTFSLVGGAPRHCAPGIPRQRHRPPTGEESAELARDRHHLIEWCLSLVARCCGAVSRVRRRRARAPWRRRRRPAPGASGGRGAGRTRSGRRRATCRRPRRAAGCRSGRRP